MEPTPAAAPPVPRVVSLLGKISLAVGAVLFIVNLLLIENAVGVVEDAGVHGGAISALRFEEWTFAVISALLIAGGVGLLREKKWGRTVSLIAGATTFLGALVAASVPGVAQNLAEIEGVKHTFHTYAGAPALSPLYGIALLVFLNMADVRAWVKPPPVGAVRPERTSTMAIMSFAMSFIPLFGILPIVSIVLGILALREVRRSNGLVGGRGFALAGISIASAWIALVLFIVILIVAMRPAPR